MNRMERFYATIDRLPVDRPASWLGLPDTKSLKGLYDYFKVNNIRELKLKLDDDIYPVELPYHSPTSNAIYTAFDFSKNSNGNIEQRTLTVPGFFENYSEPKKINDFDWPDPSKYISPDECRRVMEEVPEGYPTIGIIWSSHFQDACSAFGMEMALIKMLTEPEIFSAVIDKIVEFYLKANEIFYNSTKGKLHAVLIGNDFGSQLGLIVSPKDLRKYILPGTKKLVEQAKSHGLKVFHHSCGAIFDIIADLIEIGVDVIHPIQALAAGMEPNRLKKTFGDKVSFCGGVDAQNLLVNGTTSQVKEKVLELKKIFPTGLIISPSHEAILPDIPPQNIEALFNGIQE